MNKFLCLVMVGLLALSSPVLAQESGDLFPELGKAAGSVQKAKEGKDAGLIKIVIDNVQIVVPPMNGMPLCVGKLTAENNTNVTITKLKLRVTYGDLPIPVLFDNVAAYGNQTQSLGFAGENCKGLLNVPAVKVEECIAGPMGIGECQSKIKYVPIEGAQ